jgi:acetylglutamate kinase
MALTVLKLGGELLEAGERFDITLTSAVELARQGPLVVVHGGGREVDVEARRRGLEKRSVDGLRITDADTLDVVIAMLAGVVNTRLVAGLVAQGVRAVGLTGVDARVGLAERAPLHRAVDGSVVDLGFVGQPVPGHVPTLVVDLVRQEYVPAIATLGVDDTGQVLNVNADTLAAALAIGCGASRLIVAGATPGVLDAGGNTIPVVGEGAIERLIEDRTASAGMVAKLRACRDALAAGIAEVSIVDGTSPGDFTEAAGTRLARTLVEGWPRDRTL